MYTYLVSKQFYNGLMNANKKKNKMINYKQVKRKNKNKNIRIIPITPAPGENLALNFIAVH